MSLGTLRFFLQSSPSYKNLRQCLKTPRVNAEVQILSQGVPYTLSSLHNELKIPILVIAPQPEDARRLYEQIVVWNSQQQPIFHFPETENQPFERIVGDSETTQERLSTLARLLPTDGNPPIVVASVVAIAQKTVARSIFESAKHTLSQNEEIDVETTVNLWTKIGYKFEASVDHPGIASRRGGILDIFPIGSDFPVRIELWGNKIESIRMFDHVTQRSTSIIDSVTIIPAQETLPSLTDRVALDKFRDLIDMSNCSLAVREQISDEIDQLLEGSEVEEMNYYSGLFNRETVFQYLPEESLIVTHRPTHVTQAALSVDQRTDELRKMKEERGELPFGFPCSYSNLSETKLDLGRFPRHLQIFPWINDDIVEQERSVIPFSLPTSFYGNGRSIAKGIKEFIDKGCVVVACTSLPNRLEEILKDQTITTNVLSEQCQVPVPGSINIFTLMNSTISEGFTLPVEENKLIVLSDTELFGVAKQRTGFRRASRRRDTLLSELNPGDYVVHIEHGIARFVGTEVSTETDNDREYLVLEYAAGDKLYVPMDHVERVTPYVAPIDRAPTLTRLGTQEWAKTKERVSESTREMATELLSLYAKRELINGRAVGPDTSWQVEFEDSFPYNETPDQHAAIRDVKIDMESTKPMDRLICGDVGYGKTEIAVRAAFKAVSDGKQVAILVPTTVLAQQHYLTFTQRLRAFPVKIEVLSRFRTNREQQDIVEGVANGSIDICIGTHRLIQNDVRFKDLGLAVIDEEQRFGVDQKERLKQMRTEVDVLTMTATPIPRTLHLSLAGIRDMSTIESAPEERLPVKTYVSEFNDNIIREAIRREMDRQGQVFFLHNRVYNIDYFAKYIKTLVPDSRTAVAHGQMPENQLENTMLRFAQHDFDVLICTTIIESGLDIPNVNTLIVNRADTLGLAQLYQLRGRVGRSDRRAYTYLLVPNAKILAQASEKRLRTMLAATELGAGFQIAMKDLEIRGAGNILGAQQSGHIHAVGFDLYTKLLSEAVEELRGRSTIDKTPTEIESQEGHESSDSYEKEFPIVDLSIPANIPPSYVSDLPIRLSLYQKIGGLKTDAEVTSVNEELVDRFGPIPWQGLNLLYIMRLKISASIAGVKSIRRNGDRIDISLRYEVSGARVALKKIFDHRIDIGHSQIRMDLSKFHGDWESTLTDTVEKIGVFKQKVTKNILESGLGISSESTG